MISNPKHGWCDFKLGTFVGTPSYLTDVPIDILNTFINYHKHGVGASWFDEEGSEFTLVINPYSIFVIEEKDQPVLHDFSEIKLDNLEKELITDIESNLNGWADFIVSDDKDDFHTHRAEIKLALRDLKLYIK